ncbi:MAG: hypothetical protein ACI9K8_001713, partial [Reinekea sp.]
HQEVTRAQWPKQGGLPTSAAGPALGDGQSSTWVQA